MFDFPLKLVDDIVAARDEILDWAAGIGVVLGIVVLCYYLR